MVTTYIFRKKITFSADSENTTDLPRNGISSNCMPIDLMSRNPYRIGCSRYSVISQVQSSVSHTAVPPNVLCLKGNAFLLVFASALYTPSELRVQRKLESGK